LGYVIFELSSKNNMQVNRFSRLHAVKRYQVSVGGERLSKPQNISFTCPIRGFTVKTPFGAEDAASHIKLHSEKHHNEPVLRARISKTELIKL
jgi:hypothetical protein